MATHQDTNSSQSAIKRTVLLGLFTGTAVGVGYLLSPVPNIELMTLLVALAGGVLGRALGAICGILAATLFSVGSPYGAALPPLLIAQALGLGTAGWLGAVTAPTVLNFLRKNQRKRALTVSFILGMGATLIYDLLTNLASAITFGLDLRVVAAGALPFALLHQAGNTPLFLVLYPLLLPRCVHIAKSSLRGKSGCDLALVALLMSGGVTVTHADTGQVGEPDALSPTSGAAADSSEQKKDVANTAVDRLAVTTPSVVDTVSVSFPATQMPEQIPPTGRPLWNPYVADLRELLFRKTHYVPTRDGGFGARLVFFHEANSSPFPLFVRDGVPQAVGHRWGDDPNTIPITGQVVAEASYGQDGFGGSDGVVLFDSADPHPKQFFADTRFFAGPHQTKLRSLSFLTPHAPWRLRFEFEEIWDEDGYNFSPPDDQRFAGVENQGSSKYRTGRFTMERIVSENTGLSLAVATLRKYKTSLPVPGLDHEEIWGDHVALTWREATGAGRWRTSIYWTGRTVEQEWKRKLQASREGVVLRWGGEKFWQRHLQISAANWRVDDTGAGSWAGADSGAVRAEGQEAGVRVGLPWRLVGVKGQLAVAGWWDKYGGVLAGGSLTLAQDAPRPWWQLTVERGGRAPRSDELLTADRTTVATGTFYILPNSELTREITWRGCLLLSGRMWGTDFAVEGSVRHLRDGIVWVGSEIENQGRWGNAVEMTSHSVAVDISRLTHLWGWLQFGFSAAWRGSELREGFAPPLPPKSSAGLELLWEKHFFKEDGILELGYWIGYRGDMEDPWLPNQIYELPAIAFHDFMLGFRLVGVDLNMEVRNITDKQQQLSAGALSTGREIRWRIRWEFSQ